MKLKIYIGADHRGFERKQIIKAELAKLNQVKDVVDVGDDQLEPSDDFTEFVQKACLGILADDHQDGRAVGILICGSGQGMAMGANRFRGIRAALALTEHQAMAARREEDSNVLCLSSDHLSLEQTINIIKAWLNTDFAAEQRYIRRIEQLDEL